jgi:hypothetical protein
MIQIDPAIENTMPISSKVHINATLVQHLITTATYADEIQTAILNIDDKDLADAVTDVWNTALASTIAALNLDSTAWARSHGWAIWKALCWAFLGRKKLIDI